jgi:predicted transcriptional regulator
MSEKIQVATFAERYRMTRQAAMKYMRRGRWSMPDGMAWHSMQEDGRWFAESEGEVELPAPLTAPLQPGQKPPGPKPITPEALKFKKMYEEIRLLQNRNNDIRSQLLRDWCDCDYRAAQQFFASLTGRVMALRVDDDLAKKLNDIIQDEARQWQQRLNDELDEYEQKNREKIR